MFPTEQELPSTVAKSRASIQTDRSYSHAFQPHMGVEGWESHTTFADLSLLNYPMRNSKNIPTPRIVLEPNESAYLRNLERINSE